MLVHGLPFTRLPILFVQHLMMHVVHYLNIFPWKYGVSTELSPETIMTGFPAPDYNKLKIEFGSYAQVLMPPVPQIHTDLAPLVLLHLEQQEMLAELSISFPWPLVRFFQGINGLTVLSRRRISKDLRFFQSRISDPLSNQQDLWLNGVKLFWTLLP